MHDACFSQKLLRLCFHRTTHRSDAFAVSGHSTPLLVSNIRAVMAANEAPKWKGKAAAAAPRIIPCITEVAMPLCGMLCHPEHKLRSATVNKAYTAGSASAYVRRRTLCRLTRDHPHARHGAVCKAFGVQRGARRARVRAALWRSHDVTDAAAGLFDWSMKYQDGTQPSAPGGKPVSPEDAAWWVLMRQFASAASICCEQVVCRVVPTTVLHCHTLPLIRSLHWHRFMPSQSHWCAGALPNRARARHRARPITTQGLKFHSPPLVVQKAVRSLSRRFREAMAAHMQDHTERMRVIKGRLEGGAGGAGGGGGTDGNTAEAGGGAASVAEKEELLDELVEIVENIDYARRALPDDTQPAVSAAYTTMQGAVLDVHEYASRSAAPPASVTPVGEAVGRATYGVSRGLRLLLTFYEGGGARHLTAHSPSNVRTLDRLRRRQP